MKTPEQVKIGIPTNSRLAEDCSSITALLELKPENNGTLTSPLVPEAQFYPLRVRTIAQYINNKILQLGIIGDDTALDFNLDTPRVPPSVSSEQLRMLSPDGRGMSEVIVPSRKVFSLGAVWPTDFCLLSRAETTAEEIEEFLSGKPCRIVTSYPRLTRKALFKDSIPTGTVIEKNDGQNERLLRSMPERFDLATDIVRSRKTARSFDLSFRRLLQSQPGLWRSIYGDGRDQKVIEVAEKLRDRLGILVENRLSHKDCNGG